MLRKYLGHGIDAAHLITVN